MVFEERYLKVAQVGIPKSFMIKKCGGVEPFNEEKSSGNVWSETQADGREMWFSNKVGGRTNKIPFMSSRSSSLSS